MLRYGLLAALLALGAMTASADEARDRKARSIAVMVAEGVPHIDHLPRIETQAESHRRDSKAVVRRTIALAIVAVKGETGDHALGMSLIDQFGAEGFFSPDEQAFMDDPAPTRHERTQFAWRYEGVHVMLWALGMYPELGRPDEITDVPLLAKTLRDLGTDGLMARARLRPQSELLDAADLIYRYHWATREARLKKRLTPAGLDAGVVMERHHALNWLILPEAWDDVPTDT